MRFERDSCDRLRTRGNRSPENADYWFVDCEEYREALSARLDDEEGPREAGQSIDRHLELCDGCARWYDDAARITRRTRTAAAVPWPDVTDAVLAKVPGGAPPPAGRLRAALGVVGAAQAAAGLFALVSLGDAGGYATAGWDLALGVAFGAVAARRTPPAVLVPPLAVYVGVLAWGYLSGADGTGAGALSHGLAAAGLALVVLLGRSSGHPRGPVPPLGSAGHDHHHPPVPWPRDGSRPEKLGIVVAMDPTKAA